MKMTSLKERVFPRGGKNPALSVKPIKSHSFSLFKKGSNRIKKKIKRKRNKENIDNDHQPRKRAKTTLTETNVEGNKEKKLIVKFIGDINPTVMSEGMLVLGVVSNVTEKLVNISLPGGMRGVVKLLNVSQFYKNLIVNATGETKVPSLKKLLRVGDIVPTKVISGSDTNDKRKFYLSLDPMSINSKLSELETGLILVGSVKSKEDHGYVIDFGISSLHGFLHFEKVGHKKDLTIGKLVRCCIIKYNSMQGTSFVELSTLDEDIRNSYLSLGSTCPIHSYIPGMQFKLTVTRVMKDGVQVTYKDDPSFKGYIYEDYLPSLFPNLDKITVGAQYIGMLMYVKPLVNIPYFKVMPRKPESWVYPYGQIVKGRVKKTTGSGVFFKVGKKLLPMKCFVPISNLNDSKKMIEQDLMVESLYPVKMVVNKIRLKKIDYMRRCYIGETNSAALKEKYFAMTDVKCGDIVDCTVESLGKSQVHVKMGCLTGQVPLTHVADVPMRNPGARLRVGQKMKARVMSVDHKSRIIRLTMKPTLLDKDANILMNYADAKLDECYIGTVIRITPATLKVKFFGDVIGLVRKRFTPYCDEESLTGHYCVGQLIKCYVVSNTDHKLVLSLVSKGSVTGFRVGGKYEMEISSIEKNGLMVTVKTTDLDESVKGFVPKELICDYPGLGASMLQAFSVKQRLTGYHVLRKGQTPVFALARSIARFYEVLGANRVDSKILIKPHRVYPFIVENSSGKTIVLSPLVPFSYLRFHADASSAFDGNVDDPSEVIEKYQIVHGKILGRTGNDVSVSLKLSDVWNRDYHTSFALLDEYLDCVKKIITHQRQRKAKYLRDINLGSRVSCVVEDETSEVYEVASAQPLKDDREGEGIGNVVWIQPDSKRICVNTKASDVAENQDEECVDNEMYRAKVVYVGKELAVAVLKGKGNGKLVFIPRKRHMNDFINPPCPYTVGCHTKFWVERSKLNNYLAIDRQVTLLKERKIWNSFEESLRSSSKRKLPTEGGARKVQKLNGSNDDMEIISERLTGNAEVKEEVDSGESQDVQYVCGAVNGHVEGLEIKQELDSDDCMDQSMVSDAMNAEIDIKSENDSDENRGEGERGVYSKERILLSSSSESESDDDVNDEGKGDNFDVGFNWDVLSNRDLLSGANLKPQEESSSDDDDEEKRNTKKKRVRLSKAEREEKAREEEERLRHIEERLMRADVDPETADDFDRALLSKPNSSALWVKYMAFHLQATEIEKARAVARRALKTIAFNEEREKLNVWVALLNLENLYGNEETLSKTLAEALMCNEPYHIQLHMLNMHGQSSKFQEMERTGNMIMKKFKDVSNMWEDVGLAYFKVGKIESARQVLQRALTILEKKKHVELISKFAQMENKFGSSERAQTLYETILTSFPKRVDVWSCYVDMLVKSDSIDLARQVLERATSQSLPPKKMKTLFKKFLSFEEKYGTPENVEKVRQSAVDYVESLGSVAEK